MSFVVGENIRAFVAAITGDANSVMDWRCIHDVDKGVPAVPVRGTFEQVAATLEHYNSRGYGVFVVINETDGQGREKSNVMNVRAQFIDYDDADSQWLKLAETRLWALPPTFYVTAAIPGKFHAYWVTPKYTTANGGDVRFETLQRKLVALWHSDRKPIDLPRVMRVPGTVHAKTPSQPVYVQMVPGSGTSYPVEMLEYVLANVTVDASSGPAERHVLGDDKKAAPSFDWARYALFKIDPNQCQRDDWLKLTAAFKQAALAHVDDATARAEWDRWCAQYTENDPSENDKLWRSIRDTKTGWSFLERASGVAAERMFGGANALPPEQVRGNALPSNVTGVAGDIPFPGGTVITPGVTTTPPVPATQPGGGKPQTGAFLLPSEQAEYFKGCYFVESMGRILTPTGRYMDQAKFNGRYGSKVFVLDATGEKTTDEAWKAATRGQVFNIPKIDHVRFLPSHAPGEIIYDELGRSAVNTYIPAIIKSEKGSIAMFTEHVAKLLPDERDRRILFNYMRHCVQRKGVKTFWAPVIQSAQGAGKGVFKMIMLHALGNMYVHAPNAKELTESGGKFNGWMQSKLMIIADEIKVDDRRDMMEVLKPLISENRIEVQAKGLDQEMADNVANWIMFTNYKDAVPISAGDRRYAIFFSAIQDIGDMQAAGMTGAYFPNLYHWLATKGCAAVTYWLEHSAIDAEFDPIGAAHRAPVTSSTAEAIAAGRGNIEQCIVAAVEEGRPGFKGGWISSAAVEELIKTEGLRGSHIARGNAIRSLGYHFIGRANSKLYEENMKQPNLYSIYKDAKITNYVRDQGYSVGSTMPGKH